ncbi:hypothetical protein [Streptomyces sp. NBC_00620]|uniref:hypothetical protein n=1 Tax=Streptomyces sp. NBC_00620 TaxID=2903666 RepID=UPI0022596841|nr:hypothetical protein [Streptomyces sp. NBC_00620]MCX4976483.1 hypothetical protein [Streptomyces sp. NBC_00620]
MLPPNLTRHFWEVRRAFMQHAGTTLTPWFRLTADERTAAETEVGLFRQAIRASEEEQGLLASLRAPAPAADAPDEDTTISNSSGEECPCPGCSAVAAVLELIKREAARVEESTLADTRRATRGPVLFFAAPVSFRPAPLSSEEHARLEQDARESIGKWVAAGRPLKDTTDPAPGAVWAFEVRPRGGWVDLDSLRWDRERRDAVRRRFWDIPPVTLHDIGKA